MQEGQAVEALESLESEVNEPIEQPESTETAEETPQAPQDELTQALKERLGREKKKHNKELRTLKEQIATLMAQQNTVKPVQANAQSDEETSSLEEKMVKTLSQMAQKKKQEEQVAVLKQRYDSFEDELDSASEVYEDFDDVVRADDAPFTPVIRDMALLIPNAVDVLYKLGKNRKELKRIAALHPIEQGREVFKLSAALLANQKGKSVTNAPRPLASLKTSPTAGTSSRITNNSSVAEMRRYLKEKR